MAVNLKTEEGFEFSFDTVEELMEFTQRMNAVTESASDEGPAEDENEVPETEPKFEVGDKVRVVVNTSGGHNEGTIGEISGVRYIGSQDLWSYAVDPISGYQKNYRQHHEESDIEHVKSSPKFQTGDIVRVTESFEDVFGDRVTCGAVYNYDENLGFGEPFVGSVFLGDNEDKIELVCRAQDRLDK